MVAIGLSYLAVVTRRAQPPEIDLVSCMPKRMRSTSFVPVSIAAGIETDVSASSLTRILVTPVLVKMVLLRAVSTFDVLLADINSSRKRTFRAAGTGSVLPIAHHEQHSGSG